MTAPKKAHLRMRQAPVHAQRNRKMLFGKNGISRSRDNCDHGTSENQHLPGTQNTDKEKIQVGNGLHNAQTTKAGSGRQMIRLEGDHATTMNTHTAKGEAPLQAAAGGTISDGKKAPGQGNGATNSGIANR